MPGFYVKLRIFMPIYRAPECRLAFHVAGQGHSIRASSECRLSFPAGMKAGSLLPKEGKNPDFSMASLSKRLPEAYDKRKPGRAFNRLPA